MRRLNRLLGTSAELWVFDQTRIPSYRVYDHIFISYVSISFHTGLEHRYLQVPVLSKQCVCNVSWGKNGPQRWAHECVCVFSLGSCGFILLLNCGKLPSLPSLQPEKHENTHTMNSNTAEEQQTCSHTPKRGSSDTSKRIHN